MKTFNYLTILGLAAMSVACNEKISPKLLEGNQSVTIPGSGQQSDQPFFFRVNNTSPSIRKYHLHKSGPGNSEKRCEVSSQNRFSSSLYQSPNAKAQYDIACILEAEELSLNEFGFSFDFESSANTCEYIGYSPFSFYNYKAGNSSTQLLQVTCEEGATNADTIGVDSRAIDYFGDIGCNRMVDTTVPDSRRIKFIPPEEDKELCAYDHSTSRDGPNCDEGVIDILEYTITANEPEGGVAVPPTVKARTRKVRCAGKASACISGPITKESIQDKTSTIVISETERDKPFLDSRSYEKVPTGFSNVYYANFRRFLANPHIDFDTPFGADLFMSFDNQKIYYPNVMENYAAGKFYDGRKPIDDLDNDNITVDVPGLATPLIQFSKKAYSAEPFVGIGEKYRTSPFYTFYCLDAAKEIRARIKLAVREWDIFFSADKTEYDLISDIFRMNYSRMDNINGREDDGSLDSIEDNDVLHPFNDYKDWDDQIPMRRRNPGTTDGSLIIDGTVWEPAVGFFNDSAFPQVKPE